MTIYSFLSRFEDGLWEYLSVPILLFLAFYLTYQSGFMQVKKLPYVIKQFFVLITTKKSDERGVHPLKAFFASLGGCVGVGNIVAICTAVQIGGPGALLWIWITAFAGAMIKYSEVYLGLRFRVHNAEGGYNGGPMYFLQYAFKNRWVPKVLCLLLCVYGVEVYQFSVVTDSLVTNFGVDRYLITAVLLGLVLFAGSGGVSRVGSLSSVIIPLFVILYVGMGGWILLTHLGEIPALLGQVFSSAFSSSSALGGFVGSTLMVTISQGVRRGCYTGDLGVGYASIIHSESHAKIPQEQAALAIFDIFLDTFVICTTSIMLVLLSGVWHENISADLMVQTVLGQHFPYMNLFMPFFLFLLGYSTINAYFCVGLKCAGFLSPKYGRPVYFIYSVIALVGCSFAGMDLAQSVMTIANGLLVIINCIGIFRLRREISFDLGDSKEPEPLLMKG